MSSTSTSVSGHKRQRLPRATETLPGSRGQGTSPLPRTAKEVQELEERLSSSLSEIGLLETLQLTFADRELAVEVRLAALHGLRRAFTRLYHDGVMAGEGIVQHKNHKASAAISAPAKASTALLVNWLREQHKSLLASLFRAMATERDDDDLAVASLSTYAHFCVHSCSIEAQEEAKGNLFCVDVAEGLVTRLLASYSKEDLPPAYRGTADSGAAGTSKVPSAHVQAVRAAALSASSKASLVTALEAFRARYVEDCDDFRLHALLLVAKLCRDKRAMVIDAPGSGGKAKVLDAQNQTLAAAEGASSVLVPPSASSLLALCPPAVFLRSCVQLLLDTSLPLSQQEWEEAEHESMLRDQWSALLPAVYASDGAGDGAEGTDSDESSKGEGASASKSRAKTYRMDFSDDDNEEDDSGAASRKAEAKAAQSKRRRREADQERREGMTSDFGDGIVPLSSTPNTGAAAFRSKTRSKVAAPAPSKASSRFDDGDDDDDGLDLDDIRLDGDKDAGGKHQANEAPAEPPSSASAPKYSQLHHQRKAYCDAWLAVLMLAASCSTSSPARSTASMGLPADVLRRVLLALPTRVLPHMRAVSSSGKQPLLLADFLTACLDDKAENTSDSSNAGGIVPVLALESIFYLMQNHGLEYPRFYQRLYSLLRPEAVHAKYRAHLFKNLDLFLASGALPAYLVASFAKRALRLALSASVPYALFALPFAYNILKRHPAAAAPLLHKEPPATQADATSGAAKWPNSADPFDPLTDEPSSSRALESSLWELSALTTHCYPPVAYLARDFMKACAAGPETFAAKADYDVAGEYSANVYRELVANEVTRTTRKGGVETPVAVPFAFAKQSKWQDSDRLMLVADGSSRHLSASSLGLAAVTSAASDEVCKW